VLEEIFFVNPKGLTSMADARVDTFWNDIREGLKGDGIFSSDGPMLLVNHTEWRPASILVGIGKYGDKSCMRTVLTMLYSHDCFHSGNRHLVHGMRALPIFTTSVEIDEKVIETSSLTLAELSTLTTENHKVQDPVVALMRTEFRKVMSEPIPGCPSL
jgi:hypothetical protein